jgi:TfoX/Sxy family transcriptional regulator of competence genes
MAYNEDLAARIRASFRRRRRTFEEKQMMGGLCYMVDGKMCVGVSDDLLMVRLDPAIQADALKREGCARMDFTGRPMKAFVFVSPEGWEGGDGLDYWISLALEFNPRAKSSKKRPPKAGTSAPGRKYRTPRRH